MGVTHQGQHVAINNMSSFSALLARAGFPSVSNDTIQSESDFLAFMRTGIVPEFAFVWGFCTFDNLLRAWALHNDVKLGYTEHGWFPHYETFHIDPEGFCWDSQLANQVFMPYAICGASVMDRPAMPARFNGKADPDWMRKPYVLWPMQLLNDKVNTHGLNAIDWLPHIKYFRRRLDSHIQLIIRAHLLIPQRSDGECDAFKNLVHEASKLVNTTVSIPSGLDSIHYMLHNASGVAGMNSTVMFDARLIYNLPTWTFAHSWYSGHGDLFLSGDDSDPITVRDLSTCEANDPHTRWHRAWFTAQLKARQVHRHTDNLNDVRRCVQRWTAKPADAVPSIAHFVWIGRKIPDVYRRCLDDFVALNPELQVVLHRELSSTAPDWLRRNYDRACHVQQQADMLRAYVLYSHGGVSFDMDFAWARPLPDRLFTNGAWCGSNHRTPYENGELGAPVGHPMMQSYLAVIDSIDASTAPFAAFGPNALSKLHSDNSKICMVMHWQMFNPMCCEKEMYHPLISMSPEQRREAFAELDLPVTNPDWFPVAQHLHGSVNDQYIKGPWA